MKLFNLKIILFGVNLLVILASKLKNFTLSIIDDNNQNETNIHRNDFPHLSEHNLKLFQKYSEMRKNNSFRLGQNNPIDFNEKEFFVGSCLVKFRDNLLNLYPISQREISGFFIKYKTDVFDFIINVIPVKPY